MTEFRPGEIVRRFVDAAEVMDEGAVDQLVGELTEFELSHMVETCMDMAAVFRKALSLREVRN